MPPRPPQYNFGSKWSTYQEKLERHFRVAGVHENQKSSVLISSLCRETFKVLTKLCRPKIPSAMTYQQLCHKLAREFNQMVYQNRVTFYNLKQRTNEESVDQWLIRIQDNAERCNFGRYSQEKIKDKFVTGLCKGPVLNRLLLENPKKSLDELRIIAVNEESMSASTPTPITSISKVSQYSISFIKNDI